ncbi:MAG: prephenate dehydrogenase [Nocardiaceae bacterium]|nr:prephenate dehydrogenase [Nocardiaceae bacterium]
MATSTPPPVCVIGLGLIGGSLLRAAAQAGREVFAYNRSRDAVRAARDEGFEVSENLSATLEHAEASNAIIVVGVPMPAVDAMFDMISQLAPQCTITDVVSVKGAMLDAARHHGLAERYVGGHPMAGTAESGWAASFPELFQDAAWVVAAESDTDPGRWRDVAQLALDCGAFVVPANAADHDRAVARISHLPHVLAETLAIAGEAGHDLALGLAAGSFRDGTRVAGSSPAIVRAICEPNATALLTALDEALDELQKVRKSLADNGTLGDLADRGHAARSRYENVERTPIEDISVGEDGWAEKLCEAGRRGGVVKSLDALR